MTPLLIPWRGRSIRVRHDDPLLRPLTQRAAVIGSAMALASSEATLRTWLEVTVGEWYRVEVAEGPEVRLRRRRRT